MKILHINKFFHYTGGGDRYFFDVIKLMQDHGHQNAFFSTHGEGNRASQYEKYFVKGFSDSTVRSMPIWDKARVFANGIYSFEALSKLTRLLREDRPDVAHIYNINYQLSPSIFHALRRAQIPVVWSLLDAHILCPAATLFVHGHPCEECRTNPFAVIKHRCYKGTVPASLMAFASNRVGNLIGVKNQADCFLSASENLKRTLVNWGFEGDRIFINPHFTEADLVKPNFGNEGYCIFVGKLNFEKGVDVLLKAVKGLSINLVVVGDGPARAWMEEYIRANEMRNVKIVGMVYSIEQLYDYISKSMFTIVPSSWFDVSPLITLDSFCLGKPVIGSDCGGIPEIVDHGKNGLVFPKQNAEELRKAIHELISDPQKVVEYGRNARRKAESFYTKERHYSTLIEAYDRAIRKHGYRHGKVRSSNSEFTYIQAMSSYAPAWGFGGPIRVMLDYATWMGKKREVHVFTTDLHHEEGRRLIDCESYPGVNVKRFRMHLAKLARSNFNVVSPLLLWGLLRGISACRGPVVLHFCELRGMIPLFCTILKFFHRDRLILAHSAFGMLHHKASVRRRPYDFFFLGKTLRAIDIALAQNDHELACYRSLFAKYYTRKPATINILPLHVNLAERNAEWFDGKGKIVSSVATTRRKYSIPENATIFLFLGRLHKEKGIKRTIDVFLKYAETTKQECRLLIIGREEGYQHQAEDYIKARRAEDRIRIITGVYDTRFDYYYCADVFLGLPTIFEETMLASLEAMSCGTPAIVSREADMPFVNNEGGGIVVDFTEDVVVEAMKKVVADIHQWQRSALRSVGEHFTSERVSAVFNGIFARAVSEQRGSSACDDAG